MKEEYSRVRAPIVTLVSVMTKDPFKVLMSTVLSLRTKDQVTAEASKKLFRKASTPNSMLKLSEKEIEKLIYPVGFYKTKAKNIIRICRILIDEYKGKVPDEIDELLELPGVGRKTANVLLAVLYNW